jgi:murein DD-endopeptidase MepM/ murein hydrolase activator NlpD
MRLFHVYKRQFKYLFIGILLLIPIAFLIAQTKEELNLKINQKNEDISKLEKEIKEYQNELNGLSKQKNSLNGSIKELDLTKKKLETDILLTQKKIEKTNLKIQSLSSQIDTKQDLISNNTDAIKIGIKNTNEFELENALEVILSKESFTSAWNDIDNIISVREKIRENTATLKQIKGELEDTRKETTDAKNELLSLKKELADQKKIIEQNTTEKKKLLAQTKNSEASYQKLLKDRLAKKEAFEKELEAYESQLKYILDPKSLPRKGVLSWPLDNIYITQLFGVTKDSKRLYASGSHSGVDFRASVGTPVKAVADGTVLGVGDTDRTCPYASFGKFVFIKHNNGLSTTYGHLSLIKAENGEKVKRGEIIGYSGNTGHTTGPHLHLTVYAAGAAKMQTVSSKACEGKSYTMPIAATNAYLDPMYYLPSL